MLKIVYTLCLQRCFFTIFVVVVVVDDCDDDGDDDDDDDDEDDDDGIDVDINADVVFAGLWEKFLSLEFSFLQSTHFESFIEIIQLRENCHKFSAIFIVASFGEKKQAVKDMMTTAKVKVKSTRLGTTIAELGDE
uniref:Uncharacterized protein n=1 Tax=Glossina palpalis gambiensis TaxID=67801 RepID=A0A1B0B3Z0_9MUSC